MTESPDGTPCFTRTRPMALSTSPFLLALEELEEPTVAEELHGAALRSVTLNSTAHQHDFSAPGTPCSTRSETMPIKRSSQTARHSLRHPLLRQRKSFWWQVTFLDLFKERGVAEWLVSYLGLAETVALMRVSALFQAKPVCRILKRRRRQLVQAGLSTEVRTKLWQWVGSKSKAHTNEYFSYRLRPCPQQTAILADIDRTQHTPKLTVAQQRKMYHVLNALTQCLPEVGYCQSLVFMTAVLAKSLLSEEECFLVLHSLMLNYDFGSVVSGKFEKLKLLCYEFDCFLHTHLREIADKMHQADFSADLYAVRWLLTLFSYELPPQYLCRLWDLFFIEKWKVMIRAGLAFVQAVDVAKRKPNGSDLYCLLRSVNSDASVAKTVLQTMYHFKVTDSLMSGLLAYFEEGFPPMLEMKSEDGRRWWQQCEVEEPSLWSKTLDETLCLEDLGNPLDAYFQQSEDNCSCRNLDSTLVCGTCGSPSHSSMYCDQETEDTSVAPYM